MMLRDLFPELAPTSNIDVTGISSDSKRIARGNVFAALAGVRADGRNFIDDAIEKGACAVLTDTRPIADLAVPVLRSPQPRRELALAAARLLPDQPSVIAAVTGTNGKSSIVAFLRQIWSMCGRQAASIGTLGITAADGSRNGETLTTPDPVGLHSALCDLADAGVSHCAIEASSHGLDQCRLDGVRLAAAAFTNLSRDHLDYHSDMTAYLNTKMRLFTELLPDGAPAIIAADDPKSDQIAHIARTAGAKVLSVGWRGGDLKLSELTPRRYGQEVLLRYQGGDHIIALGLIGAFQAVNAVTAAGIALALGESPQAVFDAVGELSGVPGRMEYIGRSGEGGCVYVDFAHTPAGMETLLRAVRPHTPGRISVVFGCGGDRDRDKRAVMGQMAARWADSVIVTDDNPRSESPDSIRAMILEGCPDATEIADRIDAITSGIAHLSEGDSLVIAGKGHETGQIIGTSTIAFNDSEVAQRILVAGGGRV